MYDTATFTIFGNHGELTVNAKTGEVLRLNFDPRRDDDAQAYADIAHIDVTEWRNTYPGETLEGGRHDILDFDFYTDGGEFCEHVEDWRRERRADIAATKGH